MPKNPLYNTDIDIFSTGKRLLLLLILILTLGTQQGCSTHGSRSEASLHPRAESDEVGAILIGDYAGLSKALEAGDVETAQQALNEFLSKWEGTPYKLGGDSPTAIDCSALTSNTYRELFGIDLPRTAQAQASLGNAITPADLQPGDLVFFKTGQNQNHVGVYMGDNLFMHASSKKGVTVSQLDAPYWQKRFWKATSHHHP